MVVEECEREDRYASRKTEKPHRKEKIMKKMDAECIHTGRHDEEMVCHCRCENSDLEETCRGECSADSCRCVQKENQSVEKIW